MKINGNTITIVKQHMGGGPHNFGWLVLLNNMRIGTIMKPRAEAQRFARNLAECLRNKRP